MDCFNEGCERSIHPLPVDPRRRYYDARKDVGCTLVPCPKCHRMMDEADRDGTCGCGSAMDETPEKEK